MFKYIKLTSKCVPFDKKHFVEKFEQNLLIFRGSSLALKIEKKEHFFSQRLAERTVGISKFRLTVHFTPASEQHKAQLFITTLRPYTFSLSCLY